MDPPIMTLCLELSLDPAGVLLTREEPSSSPKPGATLCRCGASDCLEARCEEDGAAPVPDWEDMYRDAFMADEGAGMPELLASMDASVDRRADMAA